MEPERIRSTVPPWTKYLRHPNPDSPNRLIALNDDAVAEDVIELVSGVIQDLSLACYRQDFNMYAPEVWEYNDEDGRRGIVEIKYINNLYYFWDSLLARFPHLLIDNCAGGGNRIDIEMLSRSVSLWRSDYYVRWDSMSRGLSDAQLRIRLLASLLRRRIRTDAGRFIQLPQRIRKRDHRADLGARGSGVGGGRQRRAS